MHDASERFESRPTRERLSGMITVEKVLVPDRDGVMVIPPVELAWFDSARKEYRVSSTEGRRIIVTPSDLPLAGEDLSGLLRDLGGPPPDRPLFWHHPHVRPPSHLPSIAFTAVRAGPWKLIYLHANGTFLLFDLEADVGETANLADRHPERVDALADRLGAWCGLVDAQMAIRRATGRPVPRPDEQRARRAGPRGGPPAESPGG